MLVINEERYYYLFDKFYIKGLTEDECEEFGYLVTGIYIHLTPESNL